MREIFLVRDMNHFMSVANNLGIQNVNNITIITPHSDPAYLRGINEAVVWICDDWWQFSDDINDVNYVWQTIMCMRNVEFVNYDKTFSIASL